MTQYARILKNLRETALEHSTVRRPDLALMARHLARVVLADTAAITAVSAPWRARRRHFSRWTLGRRDDPAVSVMLIAWPPGYCSLPQNHTSAWDMQLTLVGALELQSQHRNAQSGDLQLHERRWLGAGDTNWFDDNVAGACRYRNLSQRETALSLHVWAGKPNQLFMDERNERPAAPWSLMAGEAAAAN